MHLRVQVVIAVTAWLFLSHCIKSESNRWNLIVEEFIRTAKAPISLAWIDDAKSNFHFILQRFPSLPRVLLRIPHNTWLQNCSSYANTDTHEYGRLQHIYSKLIDILANVEHNDFIIFTSQHSLALVSHCIVHPLSRFLLIVTDDDISTTSPSITEREFSRMLNTTWTRNGALKVFISTHNNAIYTFNPFHLNQDGSYGKLNSFVKPDFREGSVDLMQLNGYPTRVELFSSTYSLPLTKPAKTLDDFYGPDVNIARVTGELWNSTIVIVKNDGAKFGFKLPNGTLTGALNSIYRRESDIAFVTFFIKDYQTSSIEFSASVYDDDLCIIVKKAGRIPQFILPLITFDESLWIALSAFLALVILFWILIRLLNNKIHPTFQTKRAKFNLPTHFKRMSMVIQYIQLCIDASILALGAPLRRFPRIQSERFLIAGICLLSLNIVSIFQSQLATCYVRPMYYKNIGTLEQFAATGQKILIKYPAMMTDLFPENSSELFHTLHDRMVLIPDSDLTATDIGEKYGMAGVTRRIALKVNKEEDQVHLIPECPRSYNLAFVHGKHWIFAGKINAIILNLKQAGIINKWIDEVDYSIKLETARKQIHVVHHRMLRIDDLMLAFMILGFGCALSASFFITELFCKSRRCHRAKKNH